jgi:FMN phosphatase YigB (HAD superfamily)
VIKKFRDVMVSGKEGLMKPQKDIYSLAIDRWNITDPKSVLYIDDEAIHF